MVMHTICPRNFSGEEKVFPEGRSLPLSYGSDHQMIRYADITLKARLVYGHVFRKTSGSFFGYLEIISSWFG